MADKHPADLAEGLTRRIKATDEMRRALRRAATAALLDCGLEPLSRQSASSRRVALQQAQVTVAAFLKALSPAARAELAAPELEVQCMVEEAAHG